jgi:GNAT superfamily N-acetyltransferase
MIRNGAPQDLLEIMAVRTSVRENHMSAEQLAARGITPNSMTIDIEAGDLGVWVAEHKGRIVAFAMADRRDGNLFALFTHPDFEGRGFATSLLFQAEHWLAQQGLSQAKLDTHRKAKAVAFYQNRGWQESGGDAGDIYMIKQLPKSAG